MSVDITQFTTDAQLNDKDMIFDQEKYHVLTTLTAEQIATIISLFQKETGFVMSEHLVYSLPKTDPPLDTLIQLFETSFAEQNDGFPSIYVQSEELIAYLPPPELARLIIQTYKSNYTFWPVNICRDLAESCQSYQKRELHATSLIFDNTNHLIYFFDPNGKLTGYNVNAVDRLWRLYFEQCFPIDQNNNTSPNYYYVDTMNWRNKISLNYGTPQSQILDTGNCLSWCLLIAKMISTENIEPKQAYDTLALMTNYERCVHIYQFNNILYAMVENN